MKTKYFGYNRNGGSDKYSEFTETKYLKAKEEEKRWFISFGDNVLERPSEKKSVKSQSTVI